MESLPVLAIILLISTTLPSTCDGGKVLVYSADGSHWLNMKVMVEALHSRGHEITVLRSSNSWYIAEVSPYYTSITVIQDQVQHIESEDMMSSFLKRSMELRQNTGSLWNFFENYQNIFEMIGQNHQAVANFVMAIFENKTLVKQLEDTGYDVCLTDPVLPVGVLLGHYLHLPLVYNVRWLFSGEAHMALAPSPLSYVPELFSELSDKMDFFQRLSNVIYHGIVVYMHHFHSNPPYQALCDRYFEHGVTPISLILEADIWLMRVDFTFEFPRPTMPNVVYIGGFQGKTPKPLSQDLEEFVQSSGEHGVIIMSLGTLLSNLGPEKTEIFASAFASLPQKVIWRHIGQRPTSVGNNTMLVEWLPQNDLLGHPKTKAFVTHGGTNGLYEAIYHGVPIVGIPLIFDQFDNILRMKTRGVAEMLEIAELDVESVITALKNILDPQKQYKQKMLKLSHLHHDKPMKPLDTAVFWTEFVMRHRGAPHLRTESYKLPWYVYHSLDVLAFFLMCGLLMIATVWFSCRCLIRSLIKIRKLKYD